MRRWGSRSLRTRLTLLFVGFLALLDVALGAIIYFDTRAFLHDSTALRLRAQARPAIENWRAADSPQGEPQDLAAAAPALSRTLTFRETTGVVFDRQGAVLADGRRLPQEPPPAPLDRAALARALGGENDVTYTARAEGQRMIVALVPLRSVPGGAEVLGVAQLTAPLDLVDAVLVRQRSLIAFCALLAIVVGTAGGLWLTGSTLAPLQRMVVTCRQIAAGDLGRRVALPARADEVGQLAAAFDDMTARIEAAFASQRRFVADAAHELRTPVTALVGSMDVWLRGARDDPDASALLAAGMGRELDRLRRLTEQLLDLSAADAAATRAEPRLVDLAPFMETVAQHARLLAQGRDLRLESGPSVALRADPDRLEQVLLNLVDNAVQHSAPGGTIRLGWRVLDGTAEVWVADEGEGIAPDDLPHVFEPFYRGGSARSRRRGGTGLGLALVRAIVEAHGGRVGVASRPGEGARFILALPLADPAPLQARSA